MFDPNNPATAFIDPRPRDRWGRFTTEKTPKTSTSVLDLEESVEDDDTLDQDGYDDEEDLDDDDSDYEDESDDESW